MAKQLNKIQKEEIVDRLKSFLDQSADVIFAYLHGSFTKGDFNDITILGRPRILPMHFAYSASGATSKTNL